MIVAVGAITFVLSIVIDCQVLRPDRQFVIDTGGYAGYKNCSEAETVSIELEKWSNTNDFQFYVPKSSCFVCFKPPCPPSGCPPIATSQKMIVYNNLFEFGLFAFNLPERNYFRIAFNDKCYFKVEVTIKKDVNEICIIIHECEFSAMKENNCSEEILGATWKDADFTRGCIMIALAFVERDKIHYSITFDCTYIPSTLLSDNKTLQISSKDCYFNRETDTPVVEYDYLDDRERLPNGVSLILPCSPGGYAVNKSTGRFLSGDECEALVRNETEDVGFEFVIRNIYNASEDLLFPVVDKMQELRGISSLLPLYLSDTKIWKTYQEMKPVVQTNPVFENKVRQGCKIVDPPPPPSTFPPNILLGLLPDIDAIVEPVEFDVGDIGENRDLNFNDTGLVRKVQNVRNETPAEAEAEAILVFDISCGTSIVLRFDIKIFTYTIYNLGIIFLTYNC